MAAGAWLVLIEGLLYIITGAYYLSDGYGPVGGVLAGAGVFDAIVGVLLFGASLLIVAEPHHHLANGLLVLLLVGMSFLFGFGGFFIGALLATIGAIWAMAWKPSGPNMMVTVTPVSNPPAKT